MFENAKLGADYEYFSYTYLLCARLRKLFIAIFLFFLLPRSGENGSPERRCRSSGSLRMAAKLRSGSRPPVEQSEAAPEADLSQSASSRYNQLSSSPGTSRRLFKAGRESAAGGGKHFGLSITGTLK
jgi:hypothetical protein